MRRWLIAAGCFTAAAFLLTGQVRADYWYAGRHLSWLRAFAISLIDWELWTLLSPLVLLMSSRVPLTRSRRASAIAIHIPASLGLGIAKVIVETIILRRLMGPAVVPGGVGKLYLSIVVYWTVIAAVQYAGQRRLARERELRASQLETELARAQVDALKMQLHPHFLFNTLNTISGLMREDVEAADLMLAQLSELLRTILETEGRHEVPLAEEIAWLRTYFSIQQTRYGPRLQIAIDVPDDCRDALVPTLILQPIVENAIRHGFSVTPGPGRISITVRRAVETQRTTATLRIEVSDDGPGPPEPIREGYGLRNTRSRLRALYRSDGSLAVLRRTDRRGTLSRLDVPWRVAPST